MRKITSAALLLAALLGLAACGAGVSDVGGVPLRELRWYYADRALERGAICTSPQIRGVFGVEKVADDQGEGDLYKVRYAYRDRARDDFRLGVFRFCSGRGERFFRIVQRDGAPRIVEMSGPQSAAPAGG